MKKILLTGATGYIGKRLLPVLLEKYIVVCCVRDIKRFNSPFKEHKNCQLIEVDFLLPETLSAIPSDIKGAYFLMHSMSASSKGFEQMEEDVAYHFVEAINKTNAEHVVYLSGINNTEGKLSRHLSSRSRVEDILLQGDFSTTILGAGIILGSGSSSFEIMRDLVEKLPVMIAPKWLLTQSQYIAVRNVIDFLEKTLFYTPIYNKKYDIYGPNVMNYKEMLLDFAAVRKLKRYVIQVPILTPKLSSYWLNFVTSTSFNLARSLVGSMTVEIIAAPNNLAEELGITLIPFKEAVNAAFKKVEQNQIVSSWKDSAVSGRLDLPLSNYIAVPTFGCYFDKRKRKVKNIQKSMDKIWAIGGETGWYYGTWLWELRGFLDKLLGGVGLRRGRTNPKDITAGDALDFWRVILADKTQKRLLLYAEMRLPGEAWLEFKIDENDKLQQTATFRPKGLLGRLYWLLVSPFHTLIFNGMITRLAK